MATVTRNPYANVNWTTNLRVKGNMHTHTTRSDGTQSPDAVIDGYHVKGYEVLSITDHDNNLATLPTWPWTSYGRDPAVLGMLAVQSAEFSAVDHTNQFFADMWTEADSLAADFETKRNDRPYILTEIGARGGLAQINHPGRYTRTDEYYLELWNAFNTHLHGIEIYNQGDRYPGDRARWDSLLTKMRQAGNAYSLWAQSCDDSHSASHIGRNYHVYLMPDLTEASLKTAMMDGAYYVVYDPLGNDSTRHNTADTAFYIAAPMLTGVTVTDTAITLTAEQYTTCEWFTTGGTAIAEPGLTLSLDTPGIDHYVRAVLTGADNSKTYTQPFYIGGVTVAPTNYKIRLDGVDRTGSLYLGGQVRTISELRKPVI